MAELQFLKTLIFPRSLCKLQNWVYFSTSSYSKFFIINGSTIIITFIVSVKPNYKNNQKKRDKS